MDTTPFAGAAMPTSEPRIPGGAEARRSAAREAAEEFEAVFLNTMLEGMFTGIEAEPPFGGGASEETYRSMLVSEYAKQISKSGGIGIADHVYREILAIQENAQ